MRVIINIIYNSIEIKEQEQPLNEKGQKVRNNRNATIRRTKGITSRSRHLNVQKQGINAQFVSLTFRIAT